MFERHCVLLRAVLQRGDRDAGLDNLNDSSLKKARVRQVESAAPPGVWRIHYLALEYERALMAFFAEEQPQVVVNLAAQAGVRYSLKNHAAYIQSNLVGIGHVLEGYWHHYVENWCVPRVVRSMAATVFCRSTSTSIWITIR